MGLELTNDSAEAQKTEAAESAANLSANLWSPESNKGTSKPVTDTSSNQMGNLTIDMGASNKTVEAVTKSPESVAPAAGLDPKKNAVESKAPGAQPSGELKSEQASSVEDKASSKTEESKSTTDTPSEAKKDGVDDTKKPASDHPAGLTEANSLLFKAADSVVDESIYKLPKWARLPKPTPDLGCVSSFSNRYREALKMAGIIQSDGETAYRNLYQVNMTEMNKVMGLDSSKPEAQLMRKIDVANIKEGDIIQGHNPGTTSRHVGIVGGIEDGVRMVYDNYGGTWRKEPLDGRFGRYKEQNYYRAYLPPKK